MMRLTRPLRYGGLAALILACIGLLTVAAVNIVRIERQMQISATENMTWIFGQTQIEALNLAAALSSDADPADATDRVTPRHSHPSRRGPPGLGVLNC